MKEDSAAAASEATPDASAGAKVTTAWAIPVITAAILAAAFLAYYFVYVSARREYLANRNFRALALLGEQIQQSVSIHGNILDFCAEILSDKKENKHVHGLPPESFLIVRPEDRNMKPPEREREALGDYLKFLAPALEINPSQELSRGANILHIERRNDAWQLVLGTFQAGRSGADYQGSLKIDEMMKPLLGSLPFDDVILVSQEGFIVYQSKQTGPQFTTLTSLLQSQIATPVDSKQESKSSGETPTAEPPKAAEAATVRQNADRTWRTRSMHMTDLMLAGTRYKLFLQPLLISAFAGEKSRSAPASELVLCGLRSSTELDWEALSLSYTFFIWCTVFFFVVWSSYKALKILFMNHRERLRLRELGTLGVSLLLLTTVLTLSALQMDFHSNDDTDAQLRRLSANISANIHSELREMMAQLKTWCQSEEIQSDLDKVANNKTEIIRNSEPHGTPKADNYPFAGNAFWTDDDGHQIVKWSVTEYVTPMIDISQLPTFIRPTMYLSGAPSPFQFASILPPNKLEYLANLSLRTRECVPPKQPTPKDPNPKQLPDDITGGIAVLTGQPLSLIDPILPDGYGFAIVDRTGAVHFHSIKSRAGRENFLLESDGSKELYAAVFGHASPRPISIKYLGQDHRALVSPVEGISQAPWSLIVFRDLTAMRTLNLQVMTLTSTLLFVIFAGPALVVLVCWLILRPRFAPEWLWPNRHRSNTYLHQVCIYAVLVLVFLLVVAWASTEAILITCALVPFILLGATWWCYRWYGPDTARMPWRFASHGAAGARASHEYPNRYLAAVLLAFFLIGVLTPMAVFRASLDIERRLEVKQGQLDLASAIARRWMSIVERAEKSEISPDAWLRFQGDQAAWRRIVPDNLTTLNHLHTERHEGPKPDHYQGWLRHILYLLHHDYNDSSAEMLGVIDDRGNPMNWSWAQEDSRVTLRWHGAHPPDHELSESEDPLKQKGDPVNIHDDLMIRSALAGFSWPDRGVYALIALCVMAAVGGLLWALARRLFLLHAAPLRIAGTLQVAEAIREGKNVMILVPPVSDWQLEVPKKTIDVSGLKTPAAWNEVTEELFATAPHALVELRHFEYVADDPDGDTQKFALLDRLLKSEGTQVAVVMTVPVSAEDYRRKFPELETIDLRDEPFLWLKQYAGPAQALIARECSPLPALWPLGAQLANDLASESVHTEDTVASEILERADGYYRILWNECSPDQKFVLAQLASDGLLNPTNGRAIRQLIRRGLILQEPQFRIMNESFRRFLRSASTVQLKREWLNESRRSGWGKVHGAFFTSMTLFGVFLLATQNALWQSAAAYVTTALGGLGTFTKVMEALRDKTGPEKG